MLITRDVLLRSTFLRLDGRFDDAMAWIAATSEACAGHRVYQTNCLEQSGAGQLVQARPHHERGRFEAALIGQCRFVERHAATLTPFTASLLEIYDQAERSGCRQTIGLVDLPLDFEYGLAPRVARQLPAELGGPDSSTASRVRP